MGRFDGREPDALRPVRVTPNFLQNSLGSCLIEVGKTRVICSAVIEESVPPFLKGSGKGWLSAEYSMLPGSSSQRVQRERAKIGGRTHEIQRLIGRSLRVCLDLNKLGERSILIDCDVIDADGGTRTASITGAYIALVLALRKKESVLPMNLKGLLKTSVAAVSVGMVNGKPCLDLNYEEDKSADVDMNVVKTGTGHYVEVQGTAEGHPFSDSDLAELTALASKGIVELLNVQQSILEK